MIENHEITRHKFEESETGINAWEFEINLKYIYISKSYATCSLLYAKQKLTPRPAGEPSHRKQLIILSGPNCNKTRITVTIWNKAIEE